MVNEKEAKLEIHYRDYEALKAQKRLVWSIGSSAVIATLVGVLSNRISEIFLFVIPAVLFLMSGSLHYLEILEDNTEDEINQIFKDE